MNDLTQRRKMGMRDHHRELKKKCEKEGELKKKSVECLENGLNLVRIG